MLLKMATEWGWTYNDAPYYLRYTVFEDKTDTMLVSYIECTDKHADTGVCHPDRQLVTVTEQGQTCSGKVGRYVCRVNKAIKPVEKF